MDSTSLHPIVGDASAGFLPGRLGLLRRDLVLTIGLPLVAGLSVRELGGVLAHEFGHFAQGGGMRLTALVRGINSWFGASSTSAIDGTTSWNVGFARAIRASPSSCSWRASRFGSRAACWRA